jgi:hypothetical protein
MTRVIVSRCARMRAPAEGARSIPGPRADVRRVPETVPEHMRRTTGFAPDDTPTAAPSDPETNDAILFGPPALFGVKSGQMQALLALAGGLWARNARVATVAAPMATVQASKAEAPCPRAPGPCHPQPHRLREGQPFREGPARLPRGAAARPPSSHRLKGLAMTRPFLLRTDPHRRRMACDLPPHMLRDIGLAPMPLRPRFPFHPLW